MRVQSLGQEAPWRRKWQSIPVFLPGESHRQRSLAGYSPWDRKQSDTIERLTHTLLLLEGGLLPGLENRLLSNTQKWIIQRDTHWQNKRIYWEEHLCREQQGNANQENCSAMQLTDSGFTVLQLAFWVVSGWSSCLCQSVLIQGSSNVACASLGWDRFQCKGFWEVGSVQFSRSVMSNSLQPHGLQHARPPCPSRTPRVHSNS